MKISGAVNRHPKRVFGSGSIEGRAKREDQGVMIDVWTIVDAFGAALLI